MSCVSIFYVNSVSLMNRNIKKSRRRPKRTTKRRMRNTWLTNLHQIQRVTVRSEGLHWLPVLIFSLYICGISQIVLIAYCSVEYFFLQLVFLSHALITQCVIFSPKKKKAKPSKKTGSPAKDTKAGSGPNFKSKEYISEDESSSGKFLEINFVMFLF